MVTMGWGKDGRENSNNLKIVVLEFQKILIAQSLLIYIFFFGGFIFQHDIKTNYWHLSFSL